MKKHLQYFIALFFVAMISSCKVQNQVSENASPIRAKNTADVFLEGSTSPFGPKSITRNIIQDRNGNICFASYEGIIQFDGNTFTNFTKKQGLGTCNAWSVIEDKKGNLWITTDGNGVYHYDGSTFTNFTTIEGLAHNRVLSAYEDKAGNIWFSTMGGASRYNGKTFTNFTTQDGLPHNDVNVIIEDRNGRFWMGTRAEACIYDGKTFSILRNKEGIALKNVRTIIEDRNGSVWLGGDGLWRHKREEKSGNLNKFTTGAFGALFEDSKGNIWMTTNTWMEDGQPNSRRWVLSRIDRKSLNGETGFATPVWSEEGMFFGMQEDRKGNIWVGTLSGAFRYNGKSANHFKAPTTKN